MTSACMGFLKVGFNYGRTDWSRFRPKGLLARAAIGSNDSLEAIIFVAFRVHCDPPPVVLSFFLVVFCTEANLAEVSFIPSPFPVSPDAILLVHSQFDLAMLFCYALSS